MAQQSSVDARLIDTSGVRDSVLLLNESDAVSSFFDDINCSKLKGQLWIYILVFVLHAVVSAANSFTWLATLAGATVVFDLSALRVLPRERVRAGIRLLSTGVLLGHYLVLVPFYYQETTGMVLWTVAFCVFAARFRFTVGEHLALYSALFAVLTIRYALVKVVFKQEVDVLVSLLVLLFVVFAPLFGVALLLTSRARRRFLSRWRSEFGRQRERLRMKQELEYAREIQLSMLPRGAPQLAWLDIAALSLPATEVGGDYYDYFELSPERIAVVVGDVTGHGVASGLVLSGVRASLNMLQEELGQPHHVLDRLNQMLKRTSAQRMLMTFMVVVLDRRQRTAVVANAGHPPALVLRPRQRRITEVGMGSFPLGAFEETTYQEEQVELEVGDTLLLYSDGVVEALNEHGELYGWDRLHTCLARQGDASLARQSRDAVLQDVWEFKGQCEQLDDVTMVVIKVVL